MLNVHVLSPQNEVRLVRALANEIERLWPGVTASAADRVDLLVGARKGVDVDLLIAIDLETPRPVASRRPDVLCGLVAVEIKQLDATRFDRIDDQLYPIYGGKRERRSVTDQARDAAYGIKNFATASNYEDLYVYALAWLPQLEASALAGLDPAIVGTQAWAALLAAACLQNDSICRESERTRAGVRAARDRLLHRRVVTPLDRHKTERIASDAIVRDVVASIAPFAGKATVQLRGHGGSGKTTALVLLAARLAMQDGARVLLLSFHHALCGDIGHILGCMPEAAGMIGTSIHVETATSFLLDLAEAAGATIPRKEDDAIDYTVTDATFREVASYLGPYGDGAQAAAVVDEDRERFDWDHVLVDESQDWTDAERDLLLAVYGSRRIVLADGLVQLIRRHTSCDWMREVPKAERIVRSLGDSLRMQHNVAVFANAVAHAMGFANWSVEPRADLVGGRVVVLEGELDDGVALVAAMRRIALLGKANPVDNLICVPHSQIVRGDGASRRARIAMDLEAAGEVVWDACDPLTRTGAPESAEAWRVVQYDSCRGLEGWVTLLVALDDLYANRLKHPNVGSAVATTVVDPDVVARRWLLIPLTRAVHLLVVHVRDPGSQVAAILRDAAAMLPRDAVEFYPTHEIARFIGPVPDANR